MKKTFETKVNDTFDFSIDSDSLNALDIIELQNDKFHILQENQSFDVSIPSSNFNKKQYQVIVNNNKYNVNIINDLDQIIKDMGFEIGASKKVNDIKAPMPGLILDLNVSVGQEVSENDTILILEAMKMENAITAPRDGVIKTISVKKGDAVDKNQLLIEFE